MKWSLNSWLVARSRTRTKRVETHDIVIGEFGIENFEVGVVDVLEDYQVADIISMCDSESIRLSNWREKRNSLIEGVFDCKNRTTFRISSSPMEQKGDG